MNELSLIQNTPEWYAFRKTAIGASDMPIILGISPFKTRYQLWLEKTGLEQSPPGNFATERGKILEDIARQHHFMDTGIDTYPKVFRSRENPFLMASLDGYSATNRLALEIKCPLATEDHESAANGQVPEKYAYQVQQQLYCAEADIAHYYSFNGVTGHLVYVKRNEKMIAELIEAGREFWKLVTERESPELTDKDFKKVDDVELKKLVTLWREAKIAEERANNLVETLKGQMINLMPHPRIECMGVRIAKVYRKGNVDYSKVPQLEGVNLEPFRKAGSEFFTVSEKR